mgnify:CR=1 FL=1
MKFIYINLFFFILIFFSFKENLSAKNIEANYIVEVGNVDLGTLQWLLDIDENNYKTSIFLEDKGYLSLFYKFHRYLGYYLSLSIQEFYLSFFD